MSLRHVLDELTRAPDYRGQIVAVRDVAARDAEFAEEVTPLSDPVRECLRRQGIERLYSHQHEAIAAAMGGENVTVVAGTASGKTLCFFVPIAEALHERPTARALLLYPTKALAQDQLRKLADFGAGDVFVAETYDGDTPQARRRDIRKRAQVVLTNPDMLHIGILPYHTAWAQFFRELRYVVIDEMHVYAGIFGAHTANVIRRLRRVARSYGANPKFICCSATVSNPAEVAETLTGLPQRLILRDGSPRGAKTAIMWNPPLLEPRAGHRRSANMEAAELLAWLVRRDVRTIVFTLARRQAELITRYARDALRAEGLNEKVMAYRGGYLPSQRRAIEKKLFDGKLLGVVATSALELGIDIGGLDAVVMAGYPGRISSFWQRAGRAGRRQNEALVALVALETGVDQYIMAHPDYLVDHGVERLLFDPRNPYILTGHLMCASYELPLDPAEEALFGPRMGELLGLLEAERYVVKRQRWYWLQPDLYPAGQISIRSASGAAYTIVARHDGREELIGTIDEESAFRMVHPGAVYLHEGETYLVRNLDLDERQAIVEPTDADFYTEAMGVSEVKIEQAEEDDDAGQGLRWCLGEVEVTDQIVGYRKRRQVTEQDLGVEPLELPAANYSTQGLWMAMGERETALIEEQGLDLLGSLHGLEHTAIAVAPLWALCDERDLGGVSYGMQVDLGAPAVFLYDGHPGGVGISRGIFERLGEVLAAAAETIEKCPCDAGCPSCVQSPSCGDGNWPLDKRGAAMLARHLAGRWFEGREDRGKADGC
jgi:DEAD/DEAH box helicase domain-containing protein